LTAFDELTITVNPQSPNQAPTVNAGSDQTVTLSAGTNLDGMVTDDGLPNPPGAVITTWSKISGPGTVTFANVNAVDTTASFSTDGIYVLRLTADDGDLTAFDEVTIEVNTSVPVTFEVRVSANSDDAEERATGRVGLNSSDLELVFDRDDQTVGIRFSGVSVPQGAVIINAYVQFQADETNNINPTELTIQGEANDDALTFTNTSGDISGRSATSAAVPWSPAPWMIKGEAGTDQQTPNIAPIVQEIVNRSGWMSGNSLVLIITGTGKRVAESYNGDQAGAPLLHVEYALQG
jgi:hypothetical protein